LQSELRLITSPPSTLGGMASTWISHYHQDRASTAPD
jgi:hypothetical protein